MPKKSPSRYWIVRKPDDQGAVVARFDTAGETFIEPAIAGHEEFVVQSVPNRTALTDEPLDISVLTEKERGILGYAPLDTE